MSIRTTSPMVFCLAMAGALAPAHALTQQGLVAGQTVGLVSPPKPAAEIISGVVASVDERDDAIKIRRSPNTTEELKVQDGLLFSAVRYGDQVDVTVENIGGAKTIVGLVKR